MRLPRFFSRSDERFRIQAEQRRNTTRDLFIEIAGANRPNLRLIETRARSQLLVGDIQPSLGFSNDIGKQIFERERHDYEGVVTGSARMGALAR
ncbi:MAG: hypothetical protein M3O82_06910, partial [Verrucomicrobiota bacterium]|nr:hypothetical protein [Verrucomicrobiota bacterium]